MESKHIILGEISLAAGTVLQRFVAAAYEATGDTKSAIVGGAITLALGTQTVLFERMRRRTRSRP